VTVDNKEFVLAHLSESHDHVNLDLYFRIEQNVKFFIKGGDDAEVHLVGYFEEVGDEDESYVSGLTGEEASEISEEVEVKPKVQPATVAK
jgi:hypothetical protein